MKASGAVPATGLVSSFSLNGVDFRIEYPADLLSIGTFFVRSTGASGAGLRIESTIVVADRLPAPSPVVRLSDRLFRDGEEIVYFFDGNLSVRVHDASGNSIRQTIAILPRRRKRAVLAEFVAGGARSGEFENALAVQAFRHAIVYPYFALLNLTRGVSLLHGSAVCFDDRGYAFVGFDGVGKSAIARAARSQGARLLSDNFLLCDERRVYAVPEPLRNRVSGRGQAHGKEFESMAGTREDAGLVALAYTWLGTDYFLKPGAPGLLEKLAEMFFQFLPEFHDLNRYLVALRFRNDDIRVRLRARLPDPGRCFECQRATPADNRRLVHDIQAL